MQDSTPPVISDRGSTAGMETANIRMRILGEECRFEVPVPLGLRSPVELLPSAREFTDQATAIALKKAQSQGRTIRCGVHCGACCRQLVAISAVEALALGTLVGAMPPARRRHIQERFAEGIRSLEGAELLDPRAPAGDRGLVAPSGEALRDRIQAVSRRYFDLQIPCPFLEDESCSIHPERPLVCREYHVTSEPGRCRELYRTRIDKVEPPLHMSEVLAAVAARHGGTKARTLPLILALEWTATQSTALDQTFDGLGMFRDLLDVIDRENRASFEERR